MQPKTYRIYCENLISLYWDFSTNNYKNEDELNKKVKLDMGPSNGMNGGIKAF